MNSAVATRLLRHLSYGLYVVTASHDGQVTAGTIPWVVQVSGDPPLLAVAMKSGSGVSVLAAQARRFALHVLGEGQQGVAQAFFTAATVEKDLINGVRFRKGTLGIPILTDVPCAFECEVVEIVHPGDHDLVIGRIIDVHEHDQRSPLTLASTGWYYGG